MYVCILGSSTYTECVLLAGTEWQECVHVLKKLEKKMRLKTRRLRSLLREERLNGQSGQSYLIPARYVQFNAMQCTCKCTCACTLCMYIYYPFLTTFGWRLIIKKERHLKIHLMFVFTFLTPSFFGYLLLLAFFLPSSYLLKMCVLSLTCLL